MGDRVRRIAIATDAAATVVSGTGRFFTASEDTVAAVDRIGRERRSELTTAAAAK